PRQQLLGSQNDMATIRLDSVIDGMFRPIVTAAPAAKEEQRA
ncbi:hypothetical protein NB851_030495, partial [Pseudomonas aeruginosa]